MATVKLDLARRLGAIDPKLYGMFIEHLGRCIYGGIYEAGSPLSDERGFRRDVLEAARGLHVSLLRWPGGNFVSNYHWLDGVGPKDRRPVRAELAWNTAETNQVGTDEFLDYCRLLNTEPYICVNLGTGMIEEAAAWVEYCNRPVGTSHADLRAEHGFAEPRRVTYWGLGNELYGDWQIGHKTAEENARVARQCAQLMRAVDKDIKLVLCGGQDMDWDRQALLHCADVVDYISYHFYWAPVKGEDRHYSTLSRPYVSEQYLIFLAELVEHVRQLKGVKHPIGIAVDEWNQWAPGDTHDSELRGHYNLTDALSVAVYLNMMRRHCRSITLATLAQMVNVIAPIYTSPDGLFLQTSYFPLQLAVEKSGTIALDAHVQSDTYPAEYSGLAAVPYLDGFASLDEAKRKLYVSLVNLHKEETQAVEIQLCDADLASTGLAHLITGEAPEVVNNFGAEPVRTRTERVDGVSKAFTYQVPRHAHVVLELDLV